MTPILTRREFGGVCLAGMAGIAARWASGEQRLTPTHSDELRFHQIVEVSNEAEGCESALMGARIGAEEASRTAHLLGGDVTLSVARVTGMSDAEAAAREVAASAKKPSVVLVHASTASSSAISRALGDAAVLRLFTGPRVRDGSCQPLEFDVAPSLTMRADALSDWLRRQSPNSPWSITTDGSRAADVLRTRLQLRMGELLHESSAAPRDSSQRSVIVLGREEAIAPMIAELHSQDPEVRLAGPVMELPAMLNVPAEARIGSWVVAWIPSLVAYGAGELNQRFEEAAHTPLDGHAWESWFAVKIASEAALRARTADPRALCGFLESARGVFDGHKGIPMSFRRWDHQLRQPLYIAAAHPYEDPGKVFELVSQEPPRQAIGSGSVDSLLDRLGKSREEGTCARG